MLLVIALVSGGFVMDLHATATFGMWVSLTAKKSSHAFNKTVLTVLVVPILVGGFCCSVALPIVIILKNLIFLSYRGRLYRDFRRLVTEGESGTVIPPK